MTLPQATSIQIQSRDPSPAEMRAYAASRKNKWFSPPARPVKRAEPVEAVVTRIYMTAPTERVWTAQHDAHMRSYMEWCAHEPLAYLKMRCRELDVLYQEIIGEGRARRLIAPRHALMVEMKVKFPRLSIPFIASMFRRDHTVVYYALQKHGLHEPRKGRNPRRISELERRVKKMFDAGESKSEIAFALNFHPAVVGRFIKRMGWTRP